MKLLLADDHTLFRDVLKQYILRAEPNAQVSVTKDFDEALDYMKDHSDQDLIILDLCMPGMNGLEGFKTMKANYPDIPVALMSGVAEKNDVTQALDLGAIGYFPKTLSGKALIKAIQLVLTGERFVPIDHNSTSVMPAYYGDIPAHSDNVSGSDSFLSSPSTQNNGPLSANDASLTRREKDVLHYLCQGASNKDIARALDLQVVTIKLHVRGICKKLDVKNRTQAALKAQNMHLADAQV